MQERMLTVLEFMFAVAGAAALTRVSLLDFTRRLQLSDGNRTIIETLSRKPFTCVLCMGFWYGISFHPFFFDFSILEMIKFGFIGAAGSWAFYRMITGEY